MGKIKVLPTEIISKIAAGEVIERPASVVKELLENALDAHTTSIELHLKEAGKTLIHIKDSGTGIEPEDMEKVFFRHSTSKINSVDDLYRINSLGFRGEALYSIAAISDVTLRSSTQSGETGWEIHYRGDKKISLRPVSLTQGTEIEVKELFFNTPARKKFLKSDTTELRRILNTFLPYTLLYPSHRFLLVHNGKDLLNLRPEEKYTRRIAQALNLEEEDLLEVTHQDRQHDISIHAILGDINIQRVNRDLQFIFINERPVQNRSLSFHLNQLYTLIFPEDVKPFFALSIHMPPEDLDVNVHPTKREVKIKNESTLIALLRYVCEKTLMTSGKAKQVKEPIFQLQSPPLPHGLSEYPTHKDALSLSPENKDAIHVPDTFTYGNNHVTQQQNHLSKSLFEACFIGIFQNKYLLFETPTSLLVMDQHAAHERVTYERLLTQIETGHIEIQNLLMPISLKITPEEKLIWEETKNNLDSLGFATTLWDNDAIAIHSHPQLINNPETAVRNILSERNTTHYDTDTLARRACRQSIMVGNQIKKEEADSLKEQLLRCKDPFICPHGRPTVIEIQETMLNRQFLR